MRHVPPIACLLLASCGPDLTVDRTFLLLVMDGVRLEDSLGDGASSIDGTPPQEFFPRVWSELVPEGARATNAWNTTSTTTTPAHAAMVSGRIQPLANYPAEDDPGLYRAALPTVWEEMLGSGIWSSAQTFLTANATIVRPVDHSLWPVRLPGEGAEWLFVPENDTGEMPSHDDADVGLSVEDRVLSVPTRVLLANFHQVDRDAHYQGPGAYPEALTELDGPIADLWQDVRDSRDYADDTWLLLLADHGRHSHSESDPVWRHHGCSCVGCRRIPFLLLGPGVRQGVPVDDRILLQDIVPTIGALLGFPTPWADGLVMDGLFDQPLHGGQRTGLADLAVAGDHRAEVEYLADQDHRTRLVLDGSPVSSPDALDVGAPALAVNGLQAWACWREITLHEDDDSPWLLRCLATTDDGATWTDIDAPIHDTGPFWSVHLLPDGEGGLWAFYANNPTGVAAGGVEDGEGRVTVDLARFADGAWSTAPSADAPSFPTDASAVPVPDGFLVAVGGSTQGDDARDLRDVYLARATVTGEVSWSPFTPAGFGPTLGSGEHWRMELPSLTIDDTGAVLLAAVGLVDGGSVPVLARSVDQGATWSELDALPLDARLMPHLAPVWLDGAAVFAAVDASTGDGVLCRGSFDVAPVCLSVGSPRILRLTSDGTTLHILVDEGVATWGARSFPLADFLDP